MVKNRAGSVGSEILKRFNLVFDYSNQQLFLKKNNHFADPFSYNKSGIEIQHYGLQWVQETVRLETISNQGQRVVENGVVQQNNFKYKFVLKPIYVVSYVRKNSPADLSGLQKDDEIVSINNRPGYEYSLEKIYALLKSDEEKLLNIEVVRENKKLKFEFKLQNLL
jgi:hypothetical protein